MVHDPVRRWFSLSHRWERGPAEPLCSRLISFRTKTIQRRTCSPGFQGCRCRLRFSGSTQAVRIFGTGRLALFCQIGNLLTVQRHFRCPSMSERCIHETNITPPVSCLDNRRGNCCVVSWCSHAQRSCGAERSDRGRADRIQRDGNGARSASCLEQWSTCGLLVRHR